MCIDTDTHAKKINAGLGEVYVMPVIQDILECFGICSACGISVVISVVGFMYLTFLVVVFIIFFFKAELCSYTRCEVLNVQRTILFEGDLSFLFVSASYSGLG